MSSNRGRSAFVWVFLVGAVGFAILLSAISGTGFMSGAWSGLIVGGGIVVGMRLGRRRSDDSTDDSG